MKPYKIPANYLPWKDFEYQSQAIQRVRPKPINIYGEPSALENLSFMYRLWSEGYPLYCVKESLLTDMLATDVGEKIKLFANIKLAIPSYALFFPRRTIKSPAGGFIDYLIIHHEQVTNLPDFKHFIAWGGIDSNNGSLFAYKRIREDGTIQHSRFGTNDEEKKRQTLQIRNLALQSILLLQHYPEMVEKMQLTASQKVQKGFAKPKETQEPEFQIPRWLTRNRKARKLPNTSPGTGSKKRIHFRSAHWRVLAPLEEGGEDRIIWVDSAWINSEEEG